MFRYVLLGPVTGQRREYRGFRRHTPDSDGQYPLVVAYQDGEVAELWNVDPTDPKAFHHLLCLYSDNDEVVKLKMFTLKG